jgi:hypothetical protein
MATTLPAVPTTTETRPEYPCWDGVPAHIRRAVAREHTWSLRREGGATFLRDGGGLCPAERAAVLLGLDPRAGYYADDAARHLGGDPSDWDEFVADVDEGRIAPGALARALGA